MRVLKSACRCCSAGCGVNMYLEGDRVVKVEGMPEHPVNQGTLCPRGAAIPDVLYAPDRLRHPLKRIGERGENKWKQISWDEALDTIAGKLDVIRKEYGPQALAMTIGQQWHWNAGAALQFRFCHAFGSPNRSAYTNWCHGPVMAAHSVTYGAPYGTQVFPGAYDYDHQPVKCMVFWGCNPFTSRPNRSRRILDAKARGAKMIVVDPYFSSSAQKADIWAQIRPGTDVALALGLIHIVIEEGLYDKEFVDHWTAGFDQLASHVNACRPEKVEAITGVPADLVRKIALTYMENRPGIIEDYAALHQQTNGFQAHRALCILRAIAGNLDIKGGEAWTSLFPYGPKFLEATLKDTVPKADPIGWNDFRLFLQVGKNIASSSVMHVAKVPETILTGNPYPVRAYLISGANLLTTMAPRELWLQAFKSLDFMAVIDLFMTGTAQMADIVLPAAWWPEKVDLSEHSAHNCYFLLREAAPAVPECWPEEKIMSELARRLGLGHYFPWKNVEEFIDETFKPLSVAALRQHPAGMGISGQWPEKQEYKKYEKATLRTPSGKVELYSSRLKEMGYDPLPDYRDYGQKESQQLDISLADYDRRYPFILTKHNLPAYVHSQFRNIPALRRLEKEAAVEVHPTDAGRLGIRPGDQVIISSPRASITATAEVTERSQPGVLFMVHGWENNDTNALLSQTMLDPVTGAYASRECRVNIRRT
ncbi:MAG: molybdopterin-dependent oxidoreductase [Chloroflexi bacterium]|nr:molybdopterin-dependent oxidoreductase [Chloroflexota bacterium]